MSTINAKEAKYLANGLDIKNIDESLMNLIRKHSAKGKKSLIINVDLSVRTISKLEKLGFSVKILREGTTHEEIKICWA